MTHSWGHTEIITMMGDNKSRSLNPKKNNITDEYKITTNVLGLGINGKVCECFSKATNERFALKVIKTIFY